MHASLSKGHVIPTGASCINIAYAQNGHRNVRTLFSMHVSGFIKKNLP